jgi:hypothetical protein
MLLAGCGDAPPTPGPPPAPVRPMAPEPPAQSAAPTTSTPAPAPATVRSVRSAAGTFTARWSTDPDPIPLSDPFAMNVELFEDEACTKPASDGTLSVDAAMPHHGHGMNVRPKVEALGAGRFRVTGLLFHMPGRWELMFDRTRNGLLERAQTTVQLQATPTTPSASATPSTQSGMPAATPSP